MTGLSINCGCQQLLCSQLPSVLTASRDVKQGPWRSWAYSAVISFQHLCGGKVCQGQGEAEARG